MIKKSISLLILCAQFASLNDLKAQPQNDQLGAWYMYFFDTNFNDSPWGFQGDIQHRNWNIAGDLEQLLLRGGLTYSPKTAKIKFTLGYGNIKTGVYGEDNSTSTESRIYQEALFPVKFGNRFHTNHRFRYEQRLIENQNLRTRYRYNFFVNIALNRPEMKRNTIYLACYNELFINGQKIISNPNTVEYFDRNRFYAALGYVIRNGLKVQLGVMNQTTDTYGKNQIQLSLHHSFKR